VTRPSLSTADGERQRAHYERIHDAYRDHYYDDLSMRYRDEFVIGPLLRGLDLSGKSVVELACGDGHNTRLIAERFPGADFLGIDVSETACSEYARVAGFPAAVGDLTAEICLDRRFDMAFVVGGLHHCHRHLDAVLDNVHRMLVPGGLFAMVEPNARFLLEGVRRAWYRADAYFDADTEQALDHDALVAAARGRFTPLDVEFIGGPAYFTVLNSLVLRIPKTVKSATAPFATAAERFYRRIRSPAAHPMFIARWTAA